MILCLCAFAYPEFLGWRRTLAAREEIQKGQLDNSVELYEQRMSVLKRELQQQAIERIGYLHVYDPRQITPKSEPWVLTQYTLAPIITRQSTEYPLIVIDVHSRAAEREAIERAIQQKWIPVKNYGRGVLLVRNPEVDS